MVGGDRSDRLPTSPSAFRGGGLQNGSAGSTIRAVTSVDPTSLDLEGLQELVERLSEERDQLAHALESRITI
jgi:hypothetical protein